MQFPGAAVRIVSREIIFDCVSQMQVTATVSKTLSSVKNKQHIIIITNHPVIPINDLWLVHLLL